MGTLIDASVAIAIERQGLDPKELLAIGADTESGLAAITASELLHGLFRTSNVAQRERREAFLEILFSILPVIPFDLGIARIHARLGADLASQGKPVGNHDLIVAATAIARDWEVATLDLRSFPRIPGLRLARW